MKFIQQLFRLFRIQTSPKSSILGQYQAKESHADKTSASDSKASVMIDGTKFQLIDSVDALCAAIEEDGRGVLRLHSVMYENMLIELAQKLEKRYGHMSRQYQDLIPSLLLCAGCLWEFPGSYRLSLQSHGMPFKRVFGATPGFDQFGKSGICPQCGSDESLLVYECFPLEQISEADIEAICRYWKEIAIDRWRHEQQSESFCKICNQHISRGEGYLNDTYWMCENCVRKGLMTEGLKNLKSSPHYYGSALLRKARRFRK